MHFIVLILHNFSSSLNSSSATVAATAASLEECASKSSSQAVNNVPIVLQIEAENVPQSSASISPDRTVRYATLFSFQFTFSNIKFLFSVLFACTC